jgi:hypothetical protein
LPTRAAWKPFDPRARLEEIAHLAATGQLTVTVSETFPLEKIADAQEPNWACPRKTRPHYLTRLSPCAA